MSVLARVSPRLSAPGGGKEFARNAALIRELAWTQFKLKYTGSVLGYLWSLLKPAMLFGILYVIFVVLLRQRAHEFGLQLLVGIVFFTFFTECTGTAMSSIAGNAGLIQKAYFPRWVLVIASSMTAAMTFLINFTLIIAVAAPLGRVELGLRSLAAIPLVLELYVLSVGLSLLLASLFVYYRDLGHIWEILTQVLFYASAIVYPATLIPARFQPLFFLNPVAQIIEDVRHAVVVPDAPASVTMVGGVAAVPILLSVVFLAAGVLVFRGLSPKFAENL